MGKKNQTTMALSFPEEDKVKPYAHVDKKIIQSHQKKVSVLTKKILTHVFAQIGREDEELKPYYTVLKSSLGKMSGREIETKHMKASFRELLNISWLIDTIDEKNPQKKGFIAKHLLNTSSHINCSYTNGVITLVLNPTLAPFLLQLGNYTNYQLKWYMNFSSWYSTRIYELLSVYKNTGWWYVELDELRSLLDCEHKYKNETTLFLNKTLKEPLEELKGTDCEFTFEKIEAPKIQGQRGRRAVVALKFTLKNKSVSKIPKNWYVDDQRTKLINDALNNWKITEVNFYNYAPSIGMDNIKILFKEWHRRQNFDASGRIQDVEKYCNSEFVRIGKSALIEKETIKTIQKNKNEGTQLDIEDIISDVRKKLLEDK